MIYLRGRLIIVFHLIQTRTEEESPRTSSDRNNIESQNPKVKVGMLQMSLLRSTTKSKPKLFEKNGKVRIESLWIPCFLGSIFVFGTRMKKKGFGFMSFRFRFRFFWIFWRFVTRPPANVYLPCLYFFRFLYFFSDYYKPYPVCRNIESPFKKKSCIYTLNNSFIIVYIPTLFLHLRWFI